MVACLKILTKRGAIALRLVMVVVLSLGGCKKEASSDSGSLNARPATSGGKGSGAATSPVPTDLPAMSVIRISERHTDTFPSPLATPADETPAPPFTVDDGAVHLLGAAQNETDPAKLTSLGLTLGNTAVPLARCRVLLIYTTKYAGTGRRADEQRYFAFEALPATINVPSGFTGDKVEYDLEKSDAALPVLLMGVRLFPKDAQIQLGMEGEKLSVTFAGTNKTVPARGSVELSQAKQTLAVSEAAVMSRPIGTANGGAPTPATEFLARVEHGAIQFTSVLGVEWLGKYPVAAPANEGDLP